MRQVYLAWTTFWLVETTLRRLPPDLEDLPCSGRIWLFLEQYYNRILERSIINYRRKTYPGIHVVHCDRDLNTHVFTHVGWRHLQASLPALLISNGKAGNLRNLLGNTNIHVPNLSNEMYASSRPRNLHPRRRSECKEEDSHPLAIIPNICILNTLAVYVTNDVMSTRAINLRCSHSAQTLKIIIAKAHRSMIFSMRWSSRVTLTMDRCKWKQACDCKPEGII